MILAPGMSNIPVSHTHSCTGGAVHCTLPTQTSTLYIESLSHESLQLPVYMILQSPLSLIQALSASTQIVKPRQIYSWCRWNVKLWWDKEWNLQRALKNSWKALCTEKRKSTYLLVGLSQKLQAWSQPQAAWTQSGKAEQWYLQGVNM